MLGERLKVLRGKRTQEDIAKYLGISRARYSHYENGRSEPDIENLQKLAELYNTTTDYLLGRTDDPSPKESEKKMSLFFYDGLEGYDDLSPEEQEAFREHMYDEARQAIELVKKLKKQGKRGGMYER